jgi:hypothetical protein
MTPGAERAPYDFTDVFPYLNPPQWDGKSMCLCRSLLDQPGMPTVSYGRDMLHGVGMIMIRTACEQGITLPKVESESVKNLTARDKPEWQASEVEWQGVMRTAYFRSGDARTASDLLDPEFLKQMHDVLDSAEIVLAIPAATMIFACPRDMAQGLAGVAKQQYADLEADGHEVLMPHLLSVVDGTLRGYFEADEITEDFGSPPADAEDS